MTQDEMIASAEYCRTDNDDDSEFFFPPSQGVWSEEVLSTSVFQYLWSTPEQAKAYLEKEIVGRVNDELPHADFVDMLKHGVNESVVVTCIGEEYRVWDGYHRIATAIARGERVRAIVGRPKIA